MLTVDGNGTGRSRDADNLATVYQHRRLGPDRTDAFVLRHRVRDDLTIHEMDRVSCVDAQPRARTRAHREASHTTERDRSLPARPDRLHHHLGVLLVRLEDHQRAFERRLDVFVRDLRNDGDRIAETVGYDSGTALSRVFRRTDGVNPGAFRKSAELTPA